MRFERCKDSCLRPMFRRRRLLVLRALRTRTLRRRGLKRGEEMKIYEEVQNAAPRHERAQEGRRAARRVYIHTMRSDTGFSMS
jgi:hypothetical protein